MSYPRKQINSHKRNKQTYLTANSQFLVLKGYDASIHKVDPDWPVEWNSIEEVRFKYNLAFEQITCPICLEGPPVAAQITKCGHIFCWPCVLHYFSLEDDHVSNRPCPICFEQVYRNDLRSVLFHTFVNYSVGDQIDLNLMVRYEGCVEVCPFKGTINPDYTSDTNEDQNPEPTANNSQVVGNLIVVSPEDVMSNIIDREKMELQKALKDYPEEICFIESAMRLLTKRIDRLYGKKMELMKENIVATSSSNNSTCITKFYLNGYSPNTRNYLFYQSCDGQHIYLNPFNTKILKQEYKNLEDGPTKIRGKIIHSDHISMNDNYRKRFKYLAHLPISCEFQLIELEFERTGLVSDKTYKFFGHEIKRRDQERRKRLKMEKKRDKILEEKQKREMFKLHGCGYYASKIDLNSDEQFPSVSDERYCQNMGNSKVLVTPHNSDDYDYLLSSDEDDNVVDCMLDNLSIKDSASEVKTNGLMSLEHKVTTSQNEQGLKIQNDQVDVDHIASSLVPLSFNDIQFEQQVMEKKAASLQPKQSSWGSNLQQCSGQKCMQSGSFAQQLANSKANPNSSTTWARATTTVPSTLPTSLHKQQTNNLVSNKTAQEFDEDDDEPELRAPRHTEYSLNDFIIKSGPFGKAKRAKKGGVAKKAL